MPLLSATALHQIQSPPLHRAAAVARKPLFLPTINHHPITSSSSLPRTTLLSPSSSPSPPLHAQPPLHSVSISNPNCEETITVPPSANAVAAAISRASPNSPVEFVHRVEKGGEAKLVMPSPDFHRLCLEQLDLFRMVVDRNAVLSVYVRPAGSYVMDQLELRRVIFYQGIDMAESSECVIVVANFGVPAGLRAAEAALSSQHVDVLPDHGVVVLPMVKHPFVVGFLVAEIPFMEPSGDELYSPPPSSDRRMWHIEAYNNDLDASHQFTEEQRSRAVMISRSLAMAYVMDQRAMLLQQSSWQNNVRINHLVEQIRAPLSNIRTLSKMLSVHANRSEISYDIVEDILVQGNQMKETLQQLQDAVHFTKANIMRHNEETLKKLHDLEYGHPELLRSLLSDQHSREDGNKKLDSILPFCSASKDTEMPMPPLALAPQQTNIRPCNASDILEDLVGAAGPLAQKQQRQLEFSEHSRLMQVAVEESALRQALSNLVEGALLRTNVGGKVQIVATVAPAGGVLIVIDDDGPDMHYMTQMHSLIPFGADLFADGMVEDNMTWNFVAGLTVSREILESYGCVVRVISPRTPDAALGSGGTRLELWLPTLGSDSNESIQEG